MLKILVVEKRVGKEWEAKLIENDLETMQEIVGGYIEPVNLGQGIHIVCNEDGKAEGLEPNFRLGYDTIVGNAFFCSVNKHGDFASLSDEQAEKVFHFFTKQKLTVNEIEK